jgi:hypothetical protein
MILQTYLKYCTHRKQLLENYDLGELDPLTVLACNSSQQSVLSLVLLECFFSMCLKVWTPSSVVAERGECTLRFLI